MRSPFHSAFRITPQRADHGEIEELSETKAESTVEAQALGDALALQRSHQNDPNLPTEEIKTLNEAIKTGNAEEALEEDDLLTRGSPYEAVRAAVRETDGEELANTIRAWILGFIFVTAAAGINMFLSMRR